MRLWMMSKTARFDLPIYLRYPVDGRSVIKPCRFVEQYSLQSWTSLRYPLNMKVAIVLVVAVASLISAAPKSKVTPYVFPGLNTGKIVGGIEATPYEFKFIADMRRGSHYCAGSIISEEWVVTAAHCSQSAASGYTLTAGDHNINTVDGNEQTRQVVQIINHPSYGSPLQYQNDIALMKVSPPFIFNEYVGAVILPAEGFPPTPVATVTGWGALTEGGSSPSNLMKVDVPYVDDETCNSNYGGSVADSMICYGEGGKDSCQGDSGGPIVCGANKTLCGIVSWGQGCARPGYPGVYTETSYYGEWIRTATTPTEEDSEPITTVDTCGGFVDSSSAAINFMAGADLTPGQRCVWTVKGPYDSSRFQLVTSGLGAADHLYVTKYDGSTAMPGDQIEIETAGQNYTVSGGMVLITLVVGDAPSQGFNLVYFSSGFGDSTPDLTGFATLSENIGSHTYPASGQYMNGENALFVVNPASAGNRTLKFSALDVENDSTCRYDAVSLYTWVNNGYTQAARFCGTTTPPGFQIGGIALITFVTDSSVTGRGFTFDWA